MPERTALVAAERLTVMRTEPPAGTVTRACVQRPFVKAESSTAWRGPQAGAPRRPEEEPRARRRRHQIARAVPGTQHVSAAAVAAGPSALRRLAGRKAWGCSAQEEA